MTLATVRVLYAGGERRDETVEVLRVLERGAVARNGLRDHFVRRESGEERWVPADWILEVTD